MNEKLQSAIHCTLNPCLLKEACCQDPPKKQLEEHLEEA